MSQRIRFRDIVYSILILLQCLLVFSSCDKRGDKNTEKNLEGQISVSGAFALYPLTVQWANEFQVSHPKVRIDVSAGGAGKGMTDVLNGMVDFAMLSRELHQEEKDNGAVAFTVGSDAVVPVINAKNPYMDKIKERGLTAEDAKKIWITGEIKTWGQLLGTKDKRKIRVYTRSDACGAAQTWALWFGKKQEDLIGTAVFGDPGIAKAVGDDRYGIGFNNLAYAYDPQTHRPLSGLEIFPVDSDGDGKISEEEDFFNTKESLVHAIELGMYPFPPGRDLYFVSKGVPADSAAIAFLKFVLKDGQRFNEPSGYVQISGKTYSENMKTIRQEKKGSGLRKNNTDTVVWSFLGVVLFVILLSSGSKLLRSRNARRVYTQKLSSSLMLTIVIVSILFLFAMIAGLFIKSLPILHEQSLWTLLSSSEWKPSQGKFGFLPFITGTLSVTCISILIALPISLLTAIFLTEYAYSMVRKLVYPALDILAALPSVIYGVWGILMLIPVMGYSLMTASIVLCVMILPILVSLFVELFAAVPQELRDASTSLGATKWQTTSMIVLKKSLPGIFASVVLAISKAMGETIAVMMVCGSVIAIPTSLKNGFYTLPALIGNNYGEMASVPLYESAIMFAALILLVIVVIFNILSRVILYRIRKNEE